MIASASFGFAASVFSRLREVGFELLLIRDRRRDHQRLAGEGGRFGLLRVEVEAHDAHRASDAQPASSATIERAVERVSMK